MTPQYPKPSCHDVMLNRGIHNPELNLFQLYRKVCYTLYPSRASCSYLQLNFQIAPELPALQHWNGFGMTTNIINDGFECNKPTPQAATNRVAYYERYCEIFGVSIGVRGQTSAPYYEYCNNMAPFPQ